MSLTELLPTLKKLSDSDKLLLLHLLTGEILKDSGLAPSNSQDETERQGLHDSFEAVAVLAQALAAEKSATHG